MVPPSPTAQALSLVMSATLDVTLFTMQTEFRLVWVGLLTLFRSAFCAVTAESEINSDSMLSANANLVENFILFVSPA